jgi:hypothetical protein
VSERHFHWVLFGTLVALNQKEEPTKTRKLLDDSLTRTCKLVRSGSDADELESDGNGKDRKLEDILDFDEEDWEALEKQFLPQVEAPGRRGVTVRRHIFATH